jgi:hypothetical protein
VPHPRSRQCFPSGARSRSTPMRRNLQIQLELRSARHTLYCVYVLIACQVKV